MARTIIRGGAVISMDPGIGTLGEGDVLIEDETILAVGRALQADDAAVIDGSDMIVMPGLVNAHIHLWQSAIRGIGGDWAGTDYYTYVHAALAPMHTPEDTFFAEYVGALSQINAGTTTLFDWCHNNSTPAHTDAAVDAVDKAGIRAVFGHGTVKPKPKPGEPHFSEIPHPRAEIERLRKGRFASETGLLNLAMCILGPDYSTLDVTRHDLELARELDMLSSAHVWGRPNRLVSEGYRRVAQEGLLGPKHNLVHANYIDDDEIKVVVDAGASITATPPAELKGHARPPLIGRVAAAGGRPSIANDSELGVTGEMFETMRLSLQTQRLFDNQALERRMLEGESELVEYAKKNLKQIGTGGGLAEDVSVKTHDALAWATLNNAWALGLEDRIGSLTPGKKADIILLRRNDLNLAPGWNVVDTVVMFANSGNIDTVLIDGKIRKKDGKLTDTAIDVAQATNEIAERGRRLLDDSGLGRLST